MQIKFRARLTLLLLGLFVLVQLPTFFAFYYATQSSALGQAQARLDAGTHVFENLLHSRGAQLLNAVRVTTSDYGFKQAVASGDAPTIHTVLYNQAQRISADLAVLIDLDGHVVAALDAHGAPVQAGDWSGLVDQPDAQAATRVTLIDGRPYQLVIVPVRAPTQIAWIGMGFALNAQLAQNLKKIAGLDVTFLARDAQGVIWSSSTLASITPAELRQLSALPQVTGDAAPLLSIGARNYFTRAQPLLKAPDSRSESASVDAILQYSSEHAMAGYARLRRQLMVIAVLSLIATLAGALWLSRNVTRPVSLLAQAARRIGNGRYDDMLPIRHNDELGELAQAFNAMQRGIARREGQIAHQAFHDDLTALPNRAGLEKHMLEALDKARQGGRTLAVLMLDLDRFKGINDTMGHAIGDRVLVEISRRLRAGLRKNDVLARFGGDEFVLLIEDIDGASLSRRAHALIDCTTAPVELDSMELFLTVSVGMALYPAHGDQADELLRRADIAMYEAKSSQSRLQTYRPGRDAEHLYKLSLVNDLRRAIPNGQLELFYQPMLSLGRDNPLQVEALLRWHHPQHGRVPPDVFIPLAENAGIIRDITHWVMQQVIAQCAAWQAQGLEVGASLNLSAMDLGSSDLPELLRGYLARHRLDPARLVLEVTETAVMRDAAHSLDVLKRLKACGVRLAIDDFGTGYSSLSHLKRLPMDELKIDKSFVMGMAADSDDAVIVRSTIELAHNMGLKVVAEGVEDDAALAMLRHFHCDIAQGYLISRPMPLEQTTQWLRQSQSVLLQQVGAAVAASAEHL